MLYGSVATLPLVAICMALACCCAPSPHVTAAAARSNRHATHRTTMRICERLARLLGCVCAAAGWLRRPATLRTTTHTLRCTRMTPTPLQDFEVHKLASDFFHGSGTMLAHVPHTACFPQRSLPHTHPHPHPHRLYTYTRTGNIMICASIFVQPTVIITYLAVGWTLTRSIACRAPSARSVSKIGPYCL